jgi:hypothetical protein
MSFKGFIGSFSVGWSIITVVNLLTHTAEPHWMYYADAAFLIIATYAVVKVLTKSQEPPS